jgi:O-antigen/teichoic acid export membrane protein
MIGAGAIANLILNLILIPRFGILGAALATLLSYMLLPIIEYPIVRRIYPIPYEWGRLCKLLVVSTGIYLVGILLKTGQLWIDLGVGATLILVWGLALYWWRFFAQNELSAALAASSALLRIFRRGVQHMLSKA